MLASNDVAGPTVPPPAQIVKSPLVEAALVGALNPKVALFFLAFLPQFVQPGQGAPAVQMLVLGAVIAAMDTVYEICLVQAVHLMRHQLSFSGFARWQNKICGGVMIGLGIRLALQER